MAFAFEELQVYQKALNFSVAVINVVDELSTPRKHYRLLEQLEAACASVALNIAEGKAVIRRKSLNSFYTSLAVLFMKPLRCS